MITDTDLAEGDLGSPEREDKKPEAKVEQPEKKVVSDWRRQTIDPQWAAKSSKKNMKLWFFLMAIGILCGVGYYVWTADLVPSSLDFLPTSKSKLVLTVIVYSEENASAVVAGKVVREGEMIEGFKVVKIYEDKVEFEKKGKSFTKKVNE
jgi:hypothetical protein